MQRIKITSFTQTFVILLYIVLITFSPSTHFIDYIDFHDCQRVIQLLLLGLVLFDAMFNWLDKTNILPLNITIRFCFLSLLVLAICSTTLSLAPRYAAIEVTIYAALCYLTLFVASLYIQNKDELIKQITYVLWASILLYMVSFYTGYITAMAVHKPLAWPYPFYGFSNIRLFQQYQLWVLGLTCLPLLAFDLKRKISLWLYFGLTCWWVLLFYAASRGVIIGWALAMLITAIIYKKLAWPFLRMQAINAISGLASYLVLFKAIPIWVMSNTIVTSTVFRETVSDRTDLWKAAVVMIKNFPIFGVGPMHFYFYTPFGTHPHNSALQIASEWGLPASLIIFAVVAYGFYWWVRKFNINQLRTETKLKSNLAIILFFTVIANGAYSLVDGVIVMPISQVLMFTVIGLMVGQYIEKTQLRTDNNLTKKRLQFRPIFAGIALVFLVLSTMPELVRGLTSENRPLAINEKPFSMGPHIINPRIWMQQRREN